MNLSQKEKRWSKDVVKYIAMAAMLLNHIAYIFFLPEGILFEIFLNLGYLTAVTMCYFLVEGYQYTHSKKKYLQRLVLFAFLSQIPYSLAFTSGTYIEFHGFSMMTTLVLCFLILLTAEQVKNKPVRILLIVLMMLLSLFCDWALLAPIFTLLFLWAKNSDGRLKLAFLLCAVLFGLVNFVGGLTIIFPLAINLRNSFFSMAGIGLAAFASSVCTTDSARKRAQNFSKWFFLSLLSSTSAAPWDHQNCSGLVIARFFICNYSERFDFLCVIC